MGGGPVFALSLVQAPDRGCTLSGPSDACPPADDGVVQPPGTLRALPPRAVPLPAIASESTVCYENPPPKVHEVLQNEFALKRLFCTERVPTDAVSAFKCG
jgi:hypothetical protein